MKFKTQNVTSLFKITFQEWKDDKAPKMAAAMAYYAVFSMGPLLLISLTVASIFFSLDTARTKMLEQISSMVGATSAEAIAQILQNMQKSQATGITALVGVGTLILAASGVFAELQDSLNQMWRVKVVKTKGFRSLIKKRLLSFGMVFSIGFLLLVSLILTSFTESLLKNIGGLLPGIQFLWQVVSFVISFGLVTVLFACMFRYLPDGKIAWRDLWIGSAITAALFNIGKLGISLYLAHSATASAFGAAGSLVILLLWIYYSAQIFYFGAEFTQVYANSYGRGVALNAGAARLNKTFEHETRKDTHVNSNKQKQKSGSSGIKSLDDAVQKIQEIEQPLKNELFKTKLTLSNILKARKYYIMASTILGVVSYFYRQYRRKQHAEAN